MRHLSLCTYAALAALSLSTLSVAQAPSFVTSPSGLLTTEGNATFFLTFNSASGGARRFMSMDATLRGRPLAIKSFALRRDATSRATTGGNSKIDFELHMGNGDFENLDGILDDNYIGKKTLVFKKRTVNFPDWSTAPTSPPGNFDFAHNLDSTFLYLGRNDFIWT